MNTKYYLVKSVWLLIFMITAMLIQDSWRQQNYLAEVLLIIPFAIAAHFLLETIRNAGEYEKGDKEINIAYSRIERSGV